jgi:hypothetical protein
MVRKYSEEQGFNSPLLLVAQEVHIYLIDMAARFLSTLHSTSPTSPTLIHIVTTFARTFNAIILAPRSPHAPALLLCFHSNRHRSRILALRNIHLHTVPPTLITPCEHPPHSAPLPHTERRLPYLANCLSPPAVLSADHATVRLGTTADGGAGHRQFTNGIEKEGRDRGGINGIGG